MRFNNLQDWLSWQESLNPKEIELGLSRVSEVLNKLSFSSDFFCPVISVAGTNGKGSTVAFAESILLQANISVGCYTSPHLYKYNERIRINQQPVSDQVLCEAFEVIDQARDNVPLTYFEFGTLAALVVFKRFNVDIAVLEVGLGGRLDAVNVIDADVAVITSIGIDHIDWLGDDVELIGREKAGIMRAGKPAVIGFFNPPESVLTYGEQLNVKQFRLGQDYLYQCLANDVWKFSYSGSGQDVLLLGDLPVPNLLGSFQLQNAAAAIMAIRALSLPNAPDEQQIKQGLQQVKLMGRYQLISQSPQVIVDVAHNEQSAAMLADLLNEQAVCGKTIAVIAMLADKDTAAVLKKLNPQIDCWFTAGLDVSRGMDSKNMEQAVRGLHAGVKLVACETVTDACVRALAEASVNDRIIVCGSFYTVAEASRFFNVNS